MGDNVMECRAGCGACCIAPSILTPMQGMPDGKPAGMRCLHLTETNLCALYGKPERPDFCERLRPTEEMCGSSSDAAMAYLAWLETATAPESVG